MSALNEFVERRRFRRFRVKEGAFAASIPDSKKLGKIIDMAKGGLSFIYVDPGDTLDETALEIFVSDGEFYISKLPINVVSDTPIPNRLSINPITVRRQGVEFADLTPEQISAIDTFLQQYTVEDAEDLL